MGRAYAEELRQQFGLDPRTKIRTLSRGENAKAGLLIALAYRPELLLLDEPSSGLDPVVRRDILEAIIRTVADEGRTVFFSSHLLEEVERVADDLAMMFNGRVVLAGALDDVKENHHRLVLRFDSPQPSASQGAGRPEHDRRRAGMDGDLQRQTRGGRGRRRAHGRTGGGGGLAVAGRNFCGLGRDKIQNRRILMHTPAAALAWELWRRHRLRLIVIVGFLLFFALLYPTLCTLAGFNPGSPDALDEIGQKVWAHGPYRAVAPAGCASAVSPVSRLRAGGDDGADVFCL